MNNIPQVKVGIVAVSRDCFPESFLSTAEGTDRRLHKEVRCYRNL